MNKLTLRPFIRIIPFLIAIGGGARASTWDSPPVCLTNGSAAPIKLPARSRIISESWVRVATHPWLIYMPEKHRVLMAFNADYPITPMQMYSDDEGATWSDPVYMESQKYRRQSTFHDYCVGLTYLGGGRVICSDQYYTTKWEYRRWVSDDFGQTWADAPLPVGLAPGNKTLNVWTPMLVERNGQTGKAVITESGYVDSDTTVSGGDSMAYIRFSEDEALTWSPAIQPPEWIGVNEVAFCRAKNGDLVAACRTDVPPAYKYEVDNYGGTGVSISKDNGRTWSKLNKLYDWGRHQASMAVLGNGDIVMAYVVRRGYRDTPDGFPRFGIEAVVSHDNGRTWDLDHKYILAAWVGNRKTDKSKPEIQSDWWFACPENESTILLPDESLLTAFGADYRNQPVKIGFSFMPNFSEGLKYMPAPRDIGLVKWRVSGAKVNSDRTIADAPFDSDRRNLFDPSSAWSSRAQKP